LIGWMCKHSNVFSRPVLIARGLDFELQCRSAVFRSVSACRHEDLRARKGAGFSAVIAEGSHLFPFRTEKLSPPAPMVLQGQPCGRVGRRRISMTHGPLSRSRLSGPCVVKPSSSDCLRSSHTLRCGRRIMRQTSRSAAGPGRQGRTLWYPVAQRRRRLGGQGESDVSV
jgi:hypothetical protein